MTGTNGAGGMWITYLAINEGMAADHPHDKETCAARPSSGNSEKQDIGFENETKKVFK